MYIQAIDGKLYKNPTIESDNWFVKCEELEQPKVIIKINPKHTLQTARNAAIAALRAANINAKMTKQGYISKFIFPNESVVTDGAIFDIEIKAPIPVPTHYEDISDTPLGMTTEYLAWSIPFVAKDVYSYIVDKQFNQTIASFIMGRMVLPSEHEDVYSVVMKRINRQHHGLRRQLKMNGTLPGSTITLTRK